MSTVRISLLRNDRVLFAGLFGAGFILCTRGISKAPVFGWTHPVSLIGCGLGAAALLLAAQVFFKARILPLRSDRQAIYLLGGIIAAKALLALLYR